MIAVEEGNKLQIEVIFANLEDRGVNQEIALASLKFSGTAEKVSRTLAKQLAKQLLRNIF